MTSGKKADLDAVLRAHLDGSSGIVHYLDLAAGSVVNLSDSSPPYMQEAIKARLSKEPPTLVKIAPATEKEEAEDWHAFVDTIKDGKLKKRLCFARETDDESVQDGSLEDFPAEHKQWKAFHERRLRGRLTGWLNGLGLTV